MLDGKKIVIVSILRAGNGILDGMLKLIPGARVGHVGLYRDPKTLGAVEYYFKVPEGNERAGTPSSSIRCWPPATPRWPRWTGSGRLHPRSIKFVCLLTCPEGLATFHGASPDVPVYTAAIDSHLNENGYIVPGLGDAGDRLFGTK